jgi:hypothetical protein
MGGALPGHRVRATLVEGALLARPDRLLNNV